MAYKHYRNVIIFKFEPPRCCAAPLQGGEFWWSPANPKPLSDGSDLPDSSFGV